MSCQQLIFIKVKAVSKSSSTYLTRASLLHDRHLARLGLLSSWFFLGGSCSASTFRRCTRGGPLRGCRGFLFGLLGRGRFVVALQGLVALVGICDTIAISMSLPQGISDALTVVEV